MTKPQPSVTKETTVDAVIVGAGFAGLYMLYRLRELGLSTRVFEVGSGVGGTWYWNRYPGARVDIRSLEYSFSFSEELEREWRWSERYSTQPELLRYANHVADRFDLKRGIDFETRVESAVFDEATARWTVITDRGERISSRFCIMATGCLSAAKTPDFAGLDSYTGSVYRTSHWPHEGVDFTGQRVGIIGTGSSGIQSIPVIAEQAAHLHVFQRTPNYSVPAHNGPLTPEQVADWDANRAEYRRLAKSDAAGFIINPSEQLAVEATAEERQKAYEERWQIGGFSMLGAFADTGIDLEANRYAAEFAAEKIRSIVRDPAVAEKLTPKDYPFATKRLCVDTGYYATYNRDNITLVDIRETPIEAITPKGIKTSAEDFEFDSIIFATGFDAMTGALNAIDIRGRGGMPLREKWAQGPRTYLGLTIAGFPNLFIVTGPGSPSVLTNMIMSIEQHVDWITDCIKHLGEGQLATIEATEAAESAWVEHVNEVAAETLYPLANSWYMGANVPGKPRVFLPYVGGFAVYTEHCAAIAANGYEGFELNPM